MERQGAGVPIPPPDGRILKRIAAARDLRRREADLSDDGLKRLPVSANPFQYKMTFRGNRAAEASARVPRIRVSPNLAKSGFGTLAGSLLLLMTGCGSLLTASTADVAGIAGAGLAGAVTKSPAAAAGIGLGVAAAANAGLQYVERNVHRAEQDQIAAAAGQLEPGEVGQWSVSHRIPIEADGHGHLVVTRLIGSKDFRCKEIVFSVDTVADSKPQRAFYTSIVCLNGDEWKWASAEPATQRWGSLQ